MAAPRRDLSAELRSTFRPASVEGNAAALRERALLERRAVVAAVESAPNLTAAAKQLGASRRTLQNRMREFGLPYGRSGRPRALLPHGGAGETALVVVAGVTAVAGGFFVGRWWKKRRAEAGKRGASILGSYEAGARALGSW